MEDLKAKTQEEQEYFNKNINISYIDETLPKADNKIIIKHYICSIIVYGIALLILWTNPFFYSHSNELTRYLLKSFYLCYIIIAPIIYFYYRPKSLWISHNISICEYIKRIFFKLPQIHTLSVDDIKKELEYFKPTYTEKQSMMLIFIKFFFGVLMLSGLITNIELIINRTDLYTKFVHTIKTACLNLDIIAVKNAILINKNFLYNNAILFLFSIDLFVFCIGYLSELSLLKNKIRSVETSFAGVFFCLICYAPFVAITEGFIHLPQNNNYTAFGDINSPITWLFRIPAIFFLIIYASASIALGTKASNLTNRGTVSKFPYNIVRHPAYVAKNMFWLLTILPMFFVDFNGINFNLAKYIKDIILIIIAMISCATVYYFRALTEERHLIKDPEYQQYTQKVKYRFIPFII